MNKKVITEAEAFVLWKSKTKREFNPYEIGQPLLLTMVPSFLKPTVYPEIEKEYDVIIDWKQK